MDTPMLDRVTVEALLLPDTATGLRLGSGQLNSTASGRLGHPDKDSPVWVPILDEARDVRVIRGGARHGVTFASQVGTLTVTGLSAPSLARLTPNTPIRLRTLSPSTPLFYGAVLDVQTAWERLGGDLSDVQPLTTITATDAVQVLANTARYGAVVEFEHEWQNFEPLGQRAARLLGGIGIPWAAPDAGTTDWLDGTFGVWTTDGYGFGQSADEDGPGFAGFLWETGEPYAGPGLRVRLQPLPSPPVDLTAWIWVRLHGTAPGVASVTLYSGETAIDTQPVTLPAGGAWQLVQVAGRLFSTNNVTVRVRSTAAGTSTSNLVAGIAATGMSYSVGNPLCAAKGYALGSLVYESTVANHLDVAVNSTRGAWWVDAEGTIQVRGCRHGAGGTPLLLTDESLEHFTPPAAPFTGIDSSTYETFLQIEPLGSGRFRFTALTTGPHTGWSIGSADDLADGTTYEHRFTEPQTVWVSVTADGHRYQAPVTLTPVMFGPGTTTRLPGWSYVNLYHAFDTANLVNELTLENHGRQRDPENPASHIADDRNLGPFRDWTSTADYGHRATEVSTGLAYPAPGRTMFDHQDARLADEYLAASAVAAARPTLVRIYRAPGDEPLPHLDVMSPLDLRFQGTTYSCVVAGIEHEISPRAWHTTLTLMDRST